MDQANTLRTVFRNKSQETVQKNFNARVIAVSSGKGGVGKSNITLNLATELVKRNQRVVIFDADFGLANIEILAGVAPKHTFADVMKGRKIIQEVIMPCPGGVHFISGGSGIVDFIKSGDTKINFILDNFDILDKMYDIILIDTSAGVSDNVLNFIRAAKESIIVTTPEPTSLTDAYALLKSIRYVSDDRDLPKFHIIVNRTDDVKEGHEVYNKLFSVCSNFLKIELNLLGFVPFDTQLVKAVKMQQTAVIAFPKSAFAKSLGGIADNLLSNTVTIKGTSGISSFMNKLVNIFRN